MGDDDENLYLLQSTGETGASCYTRLVIKFKLKINRQQQWLRHLTDGSHTPPILVPIRKFLCSWLSCADEKKNFFFTFE
jgi:hypothetical protein